MNTTAPAGDSHRFDRVYLFRTRRGEIPRLGTRLLVLAALLLVFAEPLNTLRDPFLRFGPLRVEVARLWVATLMSLPVFLVLYFATWWAIGRRHQRTAMFLAVAMAVLGLALAASNDGGVTYALYAAAFAPFLLPVMAAFHYVAALIALLITLDFIVPRAYSSQELIQFGLLIALAGAGSIIYAMFRRRELKLLLAQEEVEELAALTERERISRDLHDLLGHTLSVIALKSELASRIAEDDAPRAVHEIREVEQVSRTALAEVRAAVEGYRRLGFAGELRSGVRALQSVGVQVDATVADVRMPPRLEGVLALALREALTNIVRHAHARHCRVSLARHGGVLVLTVSDDGTGGPIVEGLGLTGMRDRVKAVGGTLTVAARPGVTVTVSVPDAREAEAGPP